MDQKGSCTIASGFNTGRDGLVCQYQFEDGSSQFIFLHIDKESGAFGINHSLSFNSKNYVQVICSCKDLLLLSSFGEHDVNYHVFNPISKHCDTLPQPGFTRHIIRSGLAFDGHHYQVVLIHVTDTEDHATQAFFGDLQMEIFSSETGKWTRHDPSNLSLPIPEPNFEFPELRTPPLFSNGAIHWEIGGHLLVYQVTAGNCELIELPNFLEDWSWQSTMTYRRCLWESRGRVHYSYTDFEGVQTWVLLGEDDHDYYSYYNIYDRKKFRWSLSDSVNHQDLLNLQHPDFYLCHGQWEPNDVSPLAFVEDSETTYFRLPGFVVSYNPRTQVLGEVCTFTFPGVNFNCCLFFPFSYGGHYHPDTASESLELGMVDVPITGELNTFSF